MVCITQLPSLDTLATENDPWCQQATKSVFKDNISIQLITTLLMYKPSSKNVIATNDDSDQAFGQFI